MEHLKNLISEGIKLTRLSQHPSYNEEELDLKLRIASLIKLYLEAILWFFNASLLPERASSNIENAFPASDLAQAYATKRSKFKFKMNEWLDTNKQIGVNSQNPSLLIDGICQLLGSSLKVCTVAEIFESINLVFVNNFAGIPNESLKISHYLNEILCASTDLIAVLGKAYSFCP